MKTTATGQQERDCAIALDNYQLIKKEPTRFERVCQVIQGIATNLFKLALTVACYWINSTLFVLGFVAGVVFDGCKHNGVELPNPVKEQLSKIRNIWNTQQGGTCVLLGLGAFFALPVVLGITSFTVGASVGSKLSRDAVKIAEGKKPKHLPYWDVVRSAVG